MRKTVAMDTGLGTSNDKRIADWIKSTGGAADIGMAKIALGIKDTPTTSGSGSSSNRITPVKQETTEALPVSGSVWVIRPNGSRVAANASDLQKLLDRGYTYDGVRTNGTTTNMSGSNGSRDTIYRYDSTDYIDELAEAKLKSQLSALESARDKQLSALNTQKTTIKPMYQQAGLQARGQSAQGARSFAEYLAQRGLTSSGVAAQGEINRQGALQGVLGNLSQQETQAMQNIAQQETNVNNTYASDVAGAKAGTEADKLAALIQQQQFDQQRADKLAQQDIENELSRTKYEDTKLANEKQDFINTIDRFSNDFTAQKNLVLSDNDPTNDWQAPYLDNAAMQKLAAARAKYQEQGYVSEDISRALGLPVGTMTDAYKKKIDDAAKTQEVATALKLLDDFGYVTPQIAAILTAYGLKADQSTLNRLKAQYSTNKPYYKPTTGGSSGGKNWWEQ